VTEDTILSTFDVTSLYSNIPHTLGLEAIEYWLNKHPSLLEPRFNKTFILDGIRLILNNNNFQFAERHFSQIKGTCMGSKIGPVYAILTLAYLEESRLYPKIFENYSRVDAECIINNWKRYIDDVFLLWKNSYGNINDFYELVNSLSDDIKFTFESSETRIPFLDVLVMKKGNVLVTDIYSKPTDTKQYLHFKSCHAKHTKYNIPFNLARRICTIVVDPFIRDKRLKEMTLNLQKRGYPPSLITNGIRKAKSLNIETLRKPKEKNSSFDILTFVNTNNPNNINFFNNVLHRNIQFLQQDQTLNEVIQNNKIINAKRQPANLKRILTRANFRNNDQVLSVKKCNKTRCVLCPNVIEGESFMFKGCSGKFYPNANMTCDTQNVIYVIVCPGCGEIYIGETKNPLKTRFALHRSHILHPHLRVLHVSEHLATCGESKFKCFPLFKMNSQDSERRKIMESHFIKKFAATLNQNLAT